MPLRHAAEEMRDLYANEIARAIHAGHTPDPFSVTSWARYDAEASAEQPFKSLSQPSANDDDTVDQRRENGQ